MSKKHDPYSVPSCPLSKLKSKERGVMRQGRRGVGVGVQLRVAVVLVDGGPNNRVQISVFSE